MNEWMRRLLFLPPQDSTVAREIDSLHYLVITITMLGAAAITLIGGYYILRYRRRSGTATGQPRNVGRPIPLWIEGVLIAGVFSLFVLFWFIGFKQFVRLRVAPEKTVDVYVVAKKWMWIFAYPDGRSSAGRLYVPAGRPVRLLLSSRDVIHSFFVPHFRIKQDAVPGRMTTVWFEAKEPGTYDVLCTEYCGAGHSTMRAQVVAMTPEDYGRWLEGPEDEEPDTPRLAMARPSILGGVADSPGQAEGMRARGEEVATRFGCVRCHTLDGSPHIGPTWLGLYRSRIPLSDGTTVVADEAYLTQSIMDPLARLHRGFQPVMPSYLGHMAPAEVAAVVELIRALEEPPPEEVYRVPLADAGLGAHVVVPTGEADAGVSEEEELRERVRGQESEP